jgi:hypothetical protein
MSGLDDIDSGGWKSLKRAAIVAADALAHTPMPAAVVSTPG